MKNILFVFSLCVIIILSACQEASPAETPTLSSSKSVSTESESSLESLPDLSSSVSAEENSNSVESEESSKQNQEQDQNSESKSVNQTNSSECSSTTQNITKSESFSSEVQDVTVDETEQLDPHDMFHYLEKNLDKKDYGYLNWLEDCTVCIYVVNEQAVKDVVNNYDKPPVEIEYIPFKYSIVQMENIIEELKNSDIIQQALNNDTDELSVLIHLDFFKPGVLVQWRDEIPQEFVDFMETYPYRDCVDYHEGFVMPCV